MIAVIGAGPAGLAAAMTVAQNNEQVVVIDSAPRPGGQYWRHLRKVEGYKSGRSDKYFRALEESKKIIYIRGAQIWSAVQSENAITLNYLAAGIESSITVAKVILATGAHDRALPFTGWERPGVMTPGAAQALLKGHNVIAGQKILITGTGPFLLPVAVGLAAAGAQVAGIIEAHSPLRWLRSPVALLLNPQKSIELIYYIRKIYQYKLKVSFNRAVIAYDGRAASIATVDTELRIKETVSKIDCDVIAAGWGFTPDVTLGGILGCQQVVDRDGTVIFAVDRDQRSSATNIWIAGEATGIGGADLALVEGRIAALSALGLAIPARLRLARYRLQKFATALQVSYPVGNGWQGWIALESKICRCEEVSLGEICASVSELSANDARTSKLFTRAGMGMCQGRICSRNVSEIIAKQTQCEVTEQERIGYSNRPISAPISLGALANGIK
ncbi:MAG: FAD-dependent oxidoreductase [Candidatus Planktophila sp.]|nr:FAD-dependent oxidoreductase [Candidatus Planktophila sp.]MSO24452.1 FAD-dependent oxidoreductase [Candidatus Planktophila sp.]PHX70111.1 MAG: FAD/NAD(P)-binding oxidoreductase [Actinomycetota bacterium]